MSASKPVNNHPLSLYIPGEDMYSSSSAFSRPNRSPNRSPQGLNGTRKSPVMAISADYYNYAIPIPTSNKADSSEMSMKTIEMLAMIKGTTYEEAYLLDSAPHDDDGRTSTEGSTLPRQSQEDIHDDLNEDFELDEDDYLVGDTFIGYTDDFHSVYLEQTQQAAAENEEYEPEEEIFEIDI